MITWNIDNLVRTVPDNVVTTVCCVVTMTEDGYTEKTVFAQPVPYKDPTDPSFVPFDNLNEGQVVQWVQERLGPVRIAQIEKGLEQNINKQKVQTAEGLPW